jgi:prepilin-type N-terminal cleavage/methylation domain-containing protein
MKMSTPSSRKPPARKGLTLIEVIAGLALMATLLVTMLLLKARFTHQLSDSDRKLRAVAAADALLEQWWANPEKFPINRAGSVTDSPGLNWQTHLVANDVVSKLDCRVVRLDILSGDSVVTSVELMLPPERQRA